MCPVVSLFRCMFCGSTAILYCSYTLLPPSLPILPTMPSEGKRFKPDAQFGISTLPLPPSLEKNLKMISESFMGSRLRGLNILEESAERDRLYGLMTCYEGLNICWIQPTRDTELYSDSEYSSYICKINHRCFIREPLDHIVVGLDVIACYDADNRWYRGIIVNKLEEFDSWLVLFVDYGNTQRCNSSQIMKPLVNQRHNHFRIPVQAVCCRLYNILPQLPSLQTKIDGWMEKWFIKNSETFLDVKVKEIRPDYIVDCDLFNAVPSSKDDKSTTTILRHLGQDLVSSGVATYLDPIAAKQQILLEPKEEPVDTIKFEKSSHWW